MEPRELDAVVRSIGKRLEALVGKHGFVAKTTSPTVFTRKRGTSIDRIKLDITARGDVIRCLPWLIVDDRAVRKIAGEWQAGGIVQQINFEAVPPLDLTDPADITEMLALVKRLFVFFQLAAQPARLLAEAGKRYVAGFVEPTTIAPYLAVHLGSAAVATYVDGMLRGRPELWPSFVGFRGKKKLPDSGVRSDHGSELANMLARHAPREEVSEPPADCATSRNMRAANLRGHFGLWLRAWGEPVAAGHLLRVHDEAILQLYAEHQKVGPRIDNKAAIALVLRVATGEERKPKRRAPKPQHFGYHVLHGPFAG